MSSLYATLGSPQTQCLRSQRPFLECSFINDAHDKIGILSLTSSKHMPYNPRKVLFINEEEL